jgi:hypothetical protein
MTKFTPTDGDTFVEQEDLIMAKLEQPRTFNFEKLSESTYSMQFNQFHALISYLPVE